jgi:hypothetical protein
MTCAVKKIISEMKKFGLILFVNERRERGLSVQFGQVGMGIQQKKGNTNVSPFDKFLWNQEI